MPCLAHEEWISNPRALVQNIYQNSFTSSEQAWEDEITKQFRNHITGSDTSIPWLSTDSVSGSLVQCHVMVQDILDQEFYTKEYKAKCEGKDDIRSTGKYSDVLHLPEGYQIDWNDESYLKRDSRLVYYCVPVPGRNTWTRSDVIAADSQSARRDISDSTEIEPNVVEVGKKRGVPDDTMDTSDDKVKKSKDESDNKEPCEGVENSSKFQGLNMVLPTDSGMCCVALIYTSDSSPFKINDIIEITGILERVEVDSSSCEMDEEESARFPPSSIVPRVHSIEVTNCVHINPILRSMSVPDQQELLGRVLTVREELLTLIRDCVTLGDPLAAEYILLHMLSHVYARRDDVMALGKFTVNLTKCSSSKLVECLSALMSSVCETSFTLPLTISNFNNLVMIPKKDYSANRLKSGLLQLPKGMQIILDETVLEPGQLQPNGIENLKSLGNLISWQRLAYDFGFNYNIEFECDAKVLIVGEGKSLLPSDVILPLQPMVENPNYEEMKSKISSSPFLDQFRCYLTLVRQISYDEVGDELQDKIEKDFVAERKENPKEVTGDTLHRLLVIARLFGISRGHVTLQQEDWESAKCLEKDRIARVAAN